MVLISDSTIALADEQEVDPREALGADDPVGVAGDLLERRALGVGHLGPGGRLGQAGRVLRRVVVELVAGHDLARTEQLERRAAAEDRDLEVARAGQVGLDQGERVVPEGLLERAVEFGWVVDEGHPDRAAEAGRLDHQPRVGRAAANAASSARTDAGFGRPAIRPDLAPVDDRQADARGTAA